MLTLVAFFVLVLLLGYWVSATATAPATTASKSARSPPGPTPWPLLGSLHLLGQHRTPFEAFTALAKVYGDVFSITLGASKCVVVNNFSLIKEVLISKGADFGGRPDFIRFHKLFGGDRNNSLALCDWSSLQKTRRSIARTYCSPRFTSLRYDHVNAVGCKEAEVFLTELKRHDFSKPCELKPTILAACANMFTQYMCSTSFDYGDQDFRSVVRNFDEIFWEINQGYAVDFLPWLLPMYKSHMNKLSTWASDIRQFILARIINEHRLTIDHNSPPRDFTDALLMHLEEDPDLSWQHIIFELEDFLGGHSAIGNLVMVTLACAMKHKEVVKRIQKEVDAVTEGKRLPNLFDKANMPYTEATIWETLRTASSPIVPHVATINSQIDGYTIEKGTVVFVNNYELNAGEEYWDSPKEFRPERFLSPTGTIVKPAHFIPFSTGKRTCIGQRLVQCFSFIILTTLFQSFDIEPCESIQLQPGCVAVPPNCFKLLLTPRSRT